PGSGQSAQDTVERNLLATLLVASRAAQANDIPRARKLYQEVLKLDPANKNALKWLAYNTTDPHEGCTYLERLVTIQPENTKAHRLLEAGRRRCQELDQNAFGNILSYFTTTIDPTQTSKHLPQAVPIGQMLMEKGYISKD